MPDTVALEQLTETDPLRREANRGLMVAWINRDLFNRAHHSVKTSVVLYDEDKLFVAALPPVLGPNPNVGELPAALHSVGVRYYSTGIV